MPSPMQEVRRTILLEELETLDAELLQEEETKAEAEEDRPELTKFTDGGCWARSDVEKGPGLGGHQNSHVLQLGGLRC